MSIPILYNKNNNDYTTLGIGPLIHAGKVLVTRIRNDFPFLTFTYPMFSPLFKELEPGKKVVADVGPGKRSKSQRFEIVRVTKPQNGIVTIYAEHISAIVGKTGILKGSQFSGVSAQFALNQWLNLLVPRRDLSVYSDVGTNASIDFSEIGHFQNGQEALGGKQGSILQNFGGEYIFDNNDIRLMSSAGKNSGVIISYGKNLKDLVQENSIASTYTSVYPYARDPEKDGEVLLLPEIYIDGPHLDKFPDRLIQMVDFSDKEPQSVAELRTLTTQFIQNNQVGVPHVNLKLKYVDLAKATMNEQHALLEELELCDIVTVAFNELEINTTAKIVGTVWNVLLDEYDSLEIGDIRGTMSSSIKEQEKERERLENGIKWLQQAQKEASNILNNPPKGHVVIHPSLSEPQEILIMDTENINTARNVWRWNAGGLGFSSTGYNGNYGLAMTNNGAIVADRITTGTLRAINIIGVAISGSTFETIGSSRRLLLQNGEITSFISNVRQMLLSGNSFTFYHANNREAMRLGRASITFFNESGVQSGLLAAGTNAGTGQWQMHFSAVNGSNVALGSQSSNNSLYTNRLIVHSGSNARIDQTRTLFNNHHIETAQLLNCRVRAGSFMVSNNVNYQVYSNIHMNGFSITGQSDIRLKKNITPSKVNGIKETKKIKEIDFEWKEDYRPSQKRVVEEIGVDDSPEISIQKNVVARKNPQGKQFGIAAQSSAFLQEQNAEEGSHYLLINQTKQIHLNTKTNQELIEIVEDQEKRIESLEEKLNFIMERVEG
ncbi:phage tail spike protein [Enterococcus mundtii]|uniref:Peptidase S74 domain-containing protein n=1 Tax=Enterococcus mundtii TaxID=53346 RepID=A0A848MZZ6_ENTMU|nr:phage tail spike protein [Enterococcus mundtii]NMP59341.1 hypothetical protein [Enterococcus mundtii]